MASRAAAEARRAAAADRTAAEVVRACAETTLRQAKEIRAEMGENMKLLEPRKWGCYNSNMANRLASIAACMCDAGWGSEAKTLFRRSVEVRMSV